MKKELLNFVKLKRSIHVKLKFYNFLKVINISNYLIDCSPEFAEYINESLNTYMKN